MATNSGDNSSDIPLPPEESFESYNDLKQSIFAQGEAIGIAYVIGKNDKKENGRRVITWNCKKVGKAKDRRSLKNEDLRVRQRYSFKAECTVSFKARERPDNSWEIKHRGPQYSTHNHGRAPPIAFPEYRRFNTEQQQAIQAHHAAGITSSRTVAILRQDNPQIHILHRDVYNITAELGRARRQGQSPAEALIRRLEGEQEQGEIRFEWRRDTEGHISMLFIANTRLAK